MKVTNATTARSMLALPLAALLAAGPAYAVPALQLNITDGTYDALTETVVKEDTTATVNAYLKVANGTSLTDTYYLAISLEPSQASPAMLGSFTIDGTTVDVTADMVFGTPAGLSPHSIFDTYYYEVDFMFSGTQVKEVNTEDDPGFDPTAPTSAGTDLYVEAFEIDVSNLDPSVSLHFDLYNKAANNKGVIQVSKFAPFSHDAELTPSDPGDPLDPEEVPAPGTLLLIAAPLLGFGLRSMRRKTA